jgi:2-iminobutanoate/2-iminopropanoate deaminase
MSTVRPPQPDETVPQLLSPAIMQGRQGFEEKPGQISMNQPVRSSTIASPAAMYELAMTVPAGSEYLFSAGIVGTRPDGSIAADIGEQAREVWRSIGDLLTAAGYAAEDVVSYTTYAVAGNDLSVVMAARDRFFSGHRAASTLVTVLALARPEWKIEVAVIAARQR